MKILILHKNRDKVEQAVKALEANGISNVGFNSDPEKDKLILDLASKSKSELERLIEADRLLQSEQKYKDVVENQTEMVVCWKPSGQIIFGNPSYHKYHLSNPNTPFQKSNLELTTDKKRLEAKLYSLSIKNPILTDVHQSLNHLGQEVWHEWTDKAIFDDKNNITEIQSTGRDVTKQIKAEQEIKSKEEFSKAILSAIHDGIAVIDQDGTIFCTNESWKNFSGFKNSPFHNTAVGANYFRICSVLAESGDNAAQEILAGIKAVIEGSVTLFEKEYPCLMDEKIRWFLFRAAPFNSERNGAVLTYSEITDKKNNDMDLQLSYKEILATQKINHSLIENESTAKIADLVLQGIYDITGIERSRIYLYNKATHSLQLYAEKLMDGVKSTIETKAGISTSKMIPTLKPGTLFNRVATDHQILITHNSAEIKTLIGEHAPNKLIKALTGWAHKLLGIKTMALYPLLRGNDLIGMMTVSTSNILPLREKDIIFRMSQKASFSISRRLYQEEIIQGKEKFTTIANYTANWEMWINPEGKLIWTNPACYQHFGYTQGEILSMPDLYKTLIHQDDYDTIIKILQDVLSNKTDRENLEIRLNHKSGEQKWFSFSWKQVYDSNGNWLGIRSSGMDITNRKKQDEELRQKTKELKTAQTIAKLGSWEWNIETETFTLSDELCKIAGLELNQSVLTKEKLFYLVHPGSHQTLESALLRVEISQNPKDVEIRLVSLSGRDKYLLIRANASDFGAGVKQLVHGTALDISELKLSYIQSRENQDKFEKIFESIEDVYYQTNSLGLINLISPSVYKLVGYQPEEIIGKPLAILFDNPKKSENSLEANLSIDNPTQFETTLKSRTGEKIIVLVQLSHIKDDDRSTKKVQGIIRNINDRKRQEKSLQIQRERLLEIVKLNTQIIQTSDHFYYVIQITDSKKRTAQLKYISIQVGEILGLTEHELLTNENRWEHLILPEDLPKVKAAIDQVFVEKCPQHVSYRIKHSQTGEVIWVDDYACPLFDHQNEVIEIYGSVKDVSDRVNSIIKISNEKKQSIAYQYQLLSSQLNPHFIYNTLNSFQYYILKGNVEESLNHISDFSTLMRRVLENSMNKYITIDEEIRFLQQYIRISKQRMSRELSFIVESCPDVETSELLIPPMLLQPYLENALIHGFVENTRTPEIKLIIRKNEDRIECIIEDNGIGRLKSQNLKRNMPGQKIKSYGIGITKERIDLLNQISENDFRLSIDDLVDLNGEPLGTRVIISLNCIYSAFD